jgi:hypothetical protein
MASYAGLEQSMPRSIAAAIVDVVWSDPECRRIIPEVSIYNVGQNTAGGLRNMTNEVLYGIASFDRKFIEFFGGKPVDTRNAENYLDNKQWDEACTNVGRVTSIALSAAIVNHKLPKWVTMASTVDRCPKPGVWGTFHTATSVTVEDGKEYVFDWQSILMLRNPLISRSAAEWKNYNDTYRVPFSVFQGWG